MGFPLIKRLILQIKLLIDLRYLKIIQSSYCLKDTRKIESNGVALGQENFTLEENKDTSILNTDIQYETGLDINENELEKVIDGTESN